MKKMLVTYVAVAIIVLYGINVIKGFGVFEPTDEELMNKYIVENYGEKYYGELIEQNDNEYVEFKVCQNGCERYIAVIDKDFYKRHYE